MVPLNSVRASGPGPGRGPVDDVGIHGASGPAAARSGPPTSPRAKSS
jgi:hypothetical protein